MCDYTPKQNILRFYTLLLQYRRDKESFALIEYIGKTYPSTTNTVKKFQNFIRNNNTSREQYNNLVKRLINSFLNNNNIFVVFSVESLATRCPTCLTLEPQPGSNFIEETKSYAQVTEIKPEPQISEILEQLRTINSIINQF